MNNEQFRLCSSQSTYPYYFLSLNYNGSFLKVKNHFFENYLPVSNLTKDGTGIVTIQFVVNCEGKAGNYRMKTCDFDYQNAVIDDKICNQLMSLLEDLQDWLPSRNDDGDPANYHKFLSFKIREGVLIEILPKWTW